jgi:hypothetical protein
MVGHIHLSLNLNVYEDVKILFASLGMNVLVAIGFWLDWKQYSKPKTDHGKRLQRQINDHEKKLQSMQRDLDDPGRFRTFR